ncbi:MAG: thiamine pyrophosphate-dependent enzyme [Ornithinimicrobium sp.]
MLDQYLPSPEPIQLIDPTGSAVSPAADSPATSRGYAMPAVDDLRELWTRMVIARRLDRQATTLTKQGHLAVYPSAIGQDACQIAPVYAMRNDEWLFPTYRDSMAMFSRGIDPVEVLTLLRGDWHCGYDPRARHTAPACTPLATQAVHAVGSAHALTLRKSSGADLPDSGKSAGATLCFVGDGATSEGDFHEALNFAAVFNAPVVFFLQNNGFAISVPLDKQSRAPALAYKGIGYGIRSDQVDGNDAAAVLSVTSVALDHARSGRGPVLIEGHTYRMQAHTNADDDTRYRDPSQTKAWQSKDPISRLQTYLVDSGALSAEDIEATTAQAQAQAEALRDRMSDAQTTATASGDLFRHVYAEPTPHLRDQMAMVASESAGVAG